MSIKSKILQNQPTSNKDIIDWLQLSRSDNVGPITFFKILEHFGSVETALLNFDEFLKSSPNPQKKKIMRTLNCGRRI